jgi:TrpR-related protein YerC/YecD
MEKEQLEKEVWYTPQAKRLFEAILLLQNDEECALFFRDLLTLNELSDISNRWKIALELIAGKKLREIVHTLQVSSTTISRVRQRIKDGKGGFKLILTRITSI